MKEDVAEDLGERDLCPGGCGNLTDDPYGGPCTGCWNRIIDAERNMLDWWWR